MKRIKRPVYEEVLECEYCGCIWLSKTTSFSFNDLEFNDCCICKKGGCTNCTTYYRIDGVIYLYHEKCRGEIPRNVLEKMKDIDDKQDRRDYYHTLEYGRDHIC